MHVINPNITIRQKQVIYGTVLGGSCLVKTKNSKNSYLIINGKDEVWANYKINQLNSLGTSDKTPWRSVSYPIFNEVRSLFYKNNKRSLSKQSLIDLRLTDIAWSIWFGDCGQIKSNKIKLRTNIWGEAGSEAIVEYFKDMDFSAKTEQDRNCWRVVLDENSSKSFLKYVTRVLPYSLLKR